MDYYIVVFILHSSDSFHTHLWGSTTFVQQSQDLCNPNLQPSLVSQYVTMQPSATVTLGAVNNGEANNFKMELFNDIHEDSGGC